jgi:carbon starvation protein CstA
MYNFSFLIFFSLQEDSGYFFSILFSFVFIPFFVIFIWLNTVLAKKIWAQRENIPTDRMKISTVLEEIPNHTSIVISARRSRRKQRQLRMFKVILVIMAVFIVCRVPNWVFITFMMRKNVKKNIHWVLYFTFGLLVAVNCMLNPFLYSFLSETIGLANFVGDIICGALSPLVKLFKCFSKEKNRKP